MFEVGAFSAGSNSFRSSGGRTRAYFAVFFRCCPGQRGHGTNWLRRLTASAWRKHGMRERGEYSGRSGCGGLRGRHFACGFSWSFSGCRVHRPRLSGRSIAIGVDALNADSAPCRADNTQTCRICRSLEAALPLPSNPARLLTVRCHPAHTESQTPFSQAERSLLSCAKAGTCNQCHTITHEPPKSSSNSTQPPHPRIRPRPHHPRRLPTYPRQPIRVRQSPGPPLHS